MNSLRKFFRQVRTLLWTALTLLTVLAAVVVVVPLHLILRRIATNQPFRGPINQC